VGLDACVANAACMCGGYIQPAVAHWRYGLMNTMDMIIMSCWGLVILLHQFAFFLDATCPFIHPSALHSGNNS
jgi:hypothetical protein